VVSQFIVGIRKETTESAKVVISHGIWVAHLQSSPNRTAKGFISRTPVTGTSICCGARAGTGGITLYVEH
jgi:hypothetical protein